MNNWQTKKLGEVCEIVGGGTPKTGISQYWYGDICWVTPKNLGWIEDFEISTTDRKISKEGLKNSSAQLLPVGSVILSSRAPIGYVAINTVEMATNQGCRSFICGSEIFNKYLYYFLISNTELLNSLGSGSTFLEVSGSRLKEIEISLPPLSEQKEIVKVLDEKMGKIAEVKKLMKEAITDIEKILSQTLHEIFEEGKKKGWEEKMLEEVLDYEQPTQYIVNSKNYSNKYKTPVLTAGKTFVLGHTDEENNIFPVKKLPVIIFDDFTTATKFVDFPFKVKSSAMKILHGKREMADIKFLYYVIQTLELNHNTHKRYWISEYSKIKIPLPPLPEQQKIVKRLNELSEKIRKAVELQKSQLEDLKKLEKSYLREAFNGELI